MRPPIPRIRTGAHFSSAFWLIGVVSQKVGGDDYKHFAGLGRRAPYLALGMVAAMLSLLGAPPLVGGQ